MVATRQRSRAPIQRTLFVIRSPVRSCRRDRHRGHRLWRLVSVWTGTPDGVRPGRSVNLLISRMSARVALQRCRYGRRWARGEVGVRSRMPKRWRGWKSVGTSWSQGRGRGPKPRQAEGRPIVTASGYQESEICGSAASVERASEHPLADAIGVRRKSASRLSTVDEFEIHHWPKARPANSMARPFARAIRTS